MIIIQTTVDEQKKAQNLINLLLETNKIACGTFHEIQSSYKWKNELVEDSEIEISPYELPKITVLEPVFTLPEYEKWVSDSTT